MSTVEGLFCYNVPMNLANKIVSWYYCFFRQYFLNHKIYHHSLGNAFVSLCCFLLQFSLSHCFKNQKILINFFGDFITKVCNMLQLGRYQFLLLEYIPFYHSYLLSFIKTLRFLQFWRFQRCCNYREGTKFCWPLFKKILHVQASLVNQGMSGNFFQRQKPKKLEDFRERSGESLESFLVKYFLFKKVQQTFESYVKS